MVNGGGHPHTSCHISQAALPQFPICSKGWMGKSGCRGSQSRGAIACPHPPTKAPQLLEDSLEHSVAPDLCEQGILTALESSLEEIKLSVDIDPGGKVSGDKSSLGRKSPGLPGSLC